MGYAEFALIFFW